MKKIMFFLTAAILAMSLSAAPVDQITAQKKAQSFLTNELYAGKFMSQAALTPVLLKAEMGNSKINQPVYYIYNTATTFIVVAGDDRAEDILMVGDRPDTDGAGARSVKMPFLHVILCEVASGFPINYTFTPMKL